MDAEGQYVLPKVIEIADGDCELLFEQLTPQCQHTCFEIMQMVFEYHCECLIIIFFRRVFVK